jgi:hypothetical protein
MPLELPLSITLEQFENEDIVDKDVVDDDGVWCSSLLFCLVNP